MGPKKAKKILIEKSTPTPTPEPLPEPIPKPATEMPLSEDTPPPAPSYSPSVETPPPTADIDAPFDMADLEDQTEEENADAVASEAVATAPQNPKGKMDPIAALISTYYAANPYVSENGAHHELEARFGTRRAYQSIKKTDYDAVVQILKSFGYAIKDGGSGATTAAGQYSLRIQNEFVDVQTGRFKISDNIRVEIAGLDAIQLYCRTNDIQEVIKAEREAVTFTNKHSVYHNNKRVPNVVMDDFNFVVSYKLEDDVRGNIQAFVIKNWSQFKKHFRYMNRVTFIHPDFPIMVDMSIVRSSPRIKNGTATAAAATSGYQMFYTTGEAGIFTATAPVTYEIELEIDKTRIGPGTAFNSSEKITTALKQAIKLVLSGLQHTNYPVGWDEQQRVIARYMRLIRGRDWEPGRYISGYNFIGPSSQTLQLEHIAPINENSQEPNIRSNFVVTEKADGERHLLYISDDPKSEGRVYLINTAMAVIFTGAKTNNRGLWGTLLDGELITHSKTGEWLNLYAAFDIYYLKGGDVRALPFIDTVSGGGSGFAAAAETKNTKTVFRYNLLRTVVTSANMVNVVESMNKINVSPIRLESKRFYSNAGGIGAGDENKPNPAAIFAACGHILQQEKDGVFPYTIDGLIFTHAKYGVGANEEGRAGPTTKTTWKNSFKWKPTYYNTIDFLVSVVKKDDGGDLVNTKFEDGQNADIFVDLLQYKTVQLYSAYDEKRHGLVNPCQMVYDDKIPGRVDNIDENDENATVKQFYPTSPYDDSAGIAYIPLKMDAAGQMQMYTLEGDIITDKTVVEFSYDFNRDRGWRWVPLRVRHDKGENAYHVANDIWKNIHNPVTDLMITTGTNIPDTTVIDADVYYNKITAAGDSLTQRLKQFHNSIKYLLIESVVKGRDQTMIDMACGKAGDLGKWISAGLGFVFGIDLSRDNLENVKNGACVRYIHAKRNYKVVPDCLFVQGNSAFNIRSGEAMIGDKAALIGRAVFGQGDKSESRLGAGVVKCYGRGANGFNVASMQFALHYMFATEETLTAFARNLAECVALGGYFIATFYDGKMVFNLLRDKKEGEMTSLFENDQMIWGIVKQYTLSGADGEIAAKLPNNVDSVGLKIDVFQESINQWISEYLVNFDYFTRVMEEFGFILPTVDEARELGLPASTGMFDTLYTQMIKRGGDKQGNNEKDISEMTEAEKKISFLNRFCVFKKVRAVDAAKIKIGALGDVSSLPKEYDMSMPSKAKAKVKPATAPKARRIKKALKISDEDEDADIIPTPVADAPLESVSQITEPALVAAIENKGVDLNSNEATAATTATKKRAARKRIVIE